jgi:hypothetical protein
MSDLTHAQVTTSPGRNCARQWLSPDRGILIEACSVTGLVTVLATQDASETDWQAAREVLARLDTAPLGEREFMGEFDVWTTVASNAAALTAA